MMVNSEQLDAAAEHLRKRKKGPHRLAGQDTVVVAAQLSTAAQILRDAEPSVITSARVSGTASIRTGAEERPGFIEPEDQDDVRVLVLRVGILPSELHRIDRKGAVVNVHDATATKPKEPS